MNIHQLRHLVYHVRNWGPLWSFSCFGFESLNGDLIVLFHGTRDISEQVCSKYVFTVFLDYCKVLTLQMIFNFTTTNGPRSSSRLMSSKGLALMNKLTGESQRYLLLSKSVMFCLTASLFFVCTGMEGRLGNTV